MAVRVREWTAVAFWVEILTALKSDVDCLTALGEDGRSRACLSELSIVKMQGMGVPLV